jgi:hypothetical protein
MCWQKIYEIYHKGTSRCVEFFPNVCEKIQAWKKVTALLMWLIFGNKEIRKSGNPEIRKSGNPEILDHCFSSAWFYLKYVRVSKSIEQFYHNHTVIISISRKFQKISIEQFTIYTQTLSTEITSLKLSKAKTPKIEQFFCLNPAFHSTQNPPKFPGFPGFPKISHIKSTVSFDQARIFFTNIWNSIVKLLSLCQIS